MAIIESLELYNFRLFRYYKISPSQKLNLLFGANATGKTSILEAIWFLSSGNSFRTCKLNELLYQDSHTPTPRADKHENAARVSALIRNENDSISMPAAEYSVSRDTEKNKYFVANKPKKNVIQHAQTLPITLIAPEHMTLIVGAPALRRKRLNWGCFYHFPLYHQIHARFGRILKQRNKALKLRQSAEQIRQWDELLVREAKLISEYREIYVDRLTPHFQHALEHILHGVDTAKITLSYYNTISLKSITEVSEQEWLQVYAKSLQQDQKHQYTHYGPHRGDLQIRLNNKPIENNLSRGQWKIMASALFVSQSVLLKQELDIQPIILFDDFSSELDEQHRKKFIHYIQQEVDGQTFISTVSKNLIVADQIQSMNVFELDKKSA